MVPKDRHIKIYSSNIIVDWLIREIPNLILGQGLSVRLSINVNYPIACPSHLHFHYERYRSLLGGLWIRRNQFHHNEISIKGKKYALIVTPLKRFLSLNTQLT